ncbi:MAG: S9 family peptidase [Cyclobacteriaceae bacterium]|nr:S9 family peptidase [Cyclobacteriaceae bacterium]MCH8516462.1 S9 family peptidase [Cyclobacteriaceae bacterium]
MKYLFSTSLAFILSLSVFAQFNVPDLPIIMQDPKWMGSFPSSPYWSLDGEKVYFQYNENGQAESDSLYAYSLGNGEIKPLGSNLNAAHSPRYISFFNENLHVDYQHRKLKLFNDANPSGKVLLDNVGGMSQLHFVDRKHIGFVWNEQVMLLNLESGFMRSIASTKQQKSNGSKDSEQAKYLKEQQQELFIYIRSQKEKDSLRAARSKKFENFTIDLQGKNLRSLRIAPNHQQIYISLASQKTAKYTAVPDYVTEDGYTQSLNARPKVAYAFEAHELLKVDIEKREQQLVDYSEIKDLHKKPGYLKDKEDFEREVLFAPVRFSPDGKKAYVHIRSTDNKHRWYYLLSDSGELSTLLDHQEDDAWLGGPGIGYGSSEGEGGWLPDSESIWFQSEESGFSHLYAVNIKNGKKKALTSGEFEVFSPSISRKGDYWYYTSSEGDLGQRHFYRMPLKGGKRERLTLSEHIGKHEVVLSPDEKKLAILYSSATRPQELFLMDLGSTNWKQLTDGISEDFDQYEWLTPEYIQFTAEDGAQVPARLYQPKSANKNNAAVVFVHGAGYLQNAHKWWSIYFREYMFHNLLVSQGYTVIDIDYRASAGYGRDWRTGIYRHMGGKDLSDQVDGVKYLVENHGIDPKKVGIYGGSYGGFITLMAMFNAPETFAAGAALRSVTDWAHYNHGYTSNILNEPHLDPEAYRRSSPIYFAEGLQGALLICHGMVDVNVHFQDVVRLAQRLIELEKENWEFAVYPIEDHGFTEPSSWLDEYRRIYKLFNDHLLD